MIAAARPLVSTLALRALLPRTSTGVDGLIRGRGGRPTSRRRCRIAHFTLVRSETAHRTPVLVGHAKVLVILWRAIPSESGRSDRSVVCGRRPQISGLAPRRVWPGRTESRCRNFHMSFLVHGPLGHLDQRALTPVAASSSFGHKSIRQTQCLICNGWQWHPVSSGAGAGNKPQHGHASGRATDKSAPHVRR